MCITAVLGAEQILNQLVEPLQRQSQAVASGASFDWRIAEAALYCIRSAAEPSYKLHLQPTVGWNLPVLNSAFTCIDSYAPAGQCIALRRQRAIRC